MACQPGNQTLSTLTEFASITRAPAALNRLWSWLHGVTDDGLCWTSVAQDFAADLDVIMVDARGHGLSDAPEQGYSPLEQADDLAGVITGLKLSRPIVLGHSMGAMTTLALAGRYPDLPGGDRAGRSTAMVDARF